MNDRVYTHEFIRIRGANRPNYMHHMTANWSPIAQDERNQLCFGVWGTVGTTGQWPQVVNMWEEAGFDGLALGLGHELGRPSLQDEKLEKWWNEAANYRKGGLDRVLVPAPWTDTIEELCAKGATGETYAHEVLKVPAGTAWDVLELVRENAVPVHEKFGWSLVGAWATAMCNDSEVMLLWAIPSWEQWAEFEVAQRTDVDVIRWRGLATPRIEQWDRFLLVDSPLSPFRTGRQPLESDRDSFQLPD